MIYLVLCVICSSLLVFMFKVFDHYRVSAFPAIVVNYLVCVICGGIDAGLHEGIQPAQWLGSSWLWLAMLMGFCFIHVFTLTGQTALRFGVSTASVAMKLGLVIPVMWAFMIYHEPITWYKIVGIVFAAGAVILSSLKEDSTTHSPVTGWQRFLPLIVFIGSGLCDSGSQFGDKQYFSHGGSQPFVVLVFGAAFVTGAVMLAYQWRTTAITFGQKEILGGIILGIPNYGSLVFLMLALQHATGGSSVVFPVINIATVVGSTALSVLIYKEYLNRYNKIGLILAVCCILVMNYPMLRALLGI
jgi:drug/metabolite transporter (DMT)-like permease